jgi:hypothetical protein
LEACRPIQRQALRLALTPMISQMRLAYTVMYDDHGSRLIMLPVLIVMVMIPIPGAMTGSILGDAPSHKLHNSTASGLDVPTLFHRCAISNRSDGLRVRGFRRRRPQDTHESNRFLEVYRMEIQRTTVREARRVRLSYA